MGDVGAVGDVGVGLVLIDAVSTRPNVESMLDLLITGGRGWVRRCNFARLD